MRLEKVKEALESLNLSAFITDNSYNLLYLTGVFPSTGRLLVTKKEMILFLDGRYAEEAKRIAPCEVIETKDLDKSLGEHLPKEGAIGFDADQTPFSRAKKWMEKSPNVHSSEDPVAKTRQIKEASEIVLMRGAAKIALEGLEQVKRALREGISEKELAARLEIFWLEKGGYHPSFPPIIGFDKSSAFPHYHPKHPRYQTGQAVQFDIGVTVEDYQSDLSRYILPTHHPEIEEIYHIVKEAQEVALKAVKPGIRLKDLDTLARGWIDKKGFGDKFPHSLGHGIGLEVHEGPFIRSTTSEDIIAKVGMCFTVEPGIYLPGVGGVRLEETIVVTEDGHEVLTR